MTVIDARERFADRRLQEANECRQLAAELIDLADELDRRTGAAPEPLSTHVTQLQLPVTGSRP